MFSNAGETYWRGDRRCREVIEGKQSLRRTLSRTKVLKVTGSAAGSDLAVALGPCKLL